MKNKEILEDLELFVDPKPLTKEEQVGLSSFIRDLKKKKGQRPPRKQHLQRKSAQR